ncbi:MAG: hypothetical protein N5P05_000584 [Chroococcopsis gigantea SAG 12.99]|jgi:hypothetical protein|nr:hypothetical protein [Chlorogloea purpurea SAG 13.99]MDV2998978.1 hypothetical protein [Chroococcopsis gigantea SAG 12.99]
MMFLNHLLANWYMGLFQAADFLASLNDKDVDIIGNFQTSFHNFVQTGQVWALIIGIVVGYMFRGFTSY